jgi:mannose-6-phosphate isomerase-like protein (cupin superfamily)
MAEHFVAPSTGIDLDATSTDKVFALGTIVCGTDSSGNYSAEYMYVRADEAIDQYDAVKIDDDYECSALTTAISGVEPTMVGVAQVAAADTEYFWVVISGSGTVSCISSGSAAADVKLYTTATAGFLDDASTSTDLVQGIKLTAANATNQAAFFAAGRMRTNSQD